MEFVVEMKREDFFKKGSINNPYTTTFKEISESVGDGNKIYKNTEEYIDNLYSIYLKPLDDKGVDRICNKIYIRHKNRRKDKWILICKMKDNSYSICEYSSNNSSNEIIITSKGYRKRWMIKHGYIKRDSELKREDREINNRFRKSKYNR